MLYRKLLYENYRTIGFGGRNPEDEKSRRGREDGYRDQFLRFLPEDKGAKILDLGCGSGFLMDFFKKAGFHDILGVDVSREQVVFTQAKGFEVICADALSFLKGTSMEFDLIISTNMIEHLLKDEIVEFLQKIHERLKPGGKVLLGTDNASSVIGGTERYIDFTHEILFAEKSLNDLLNACGFSNVEITDNKIPFGWRPRRFLRWFLSKIWRCILRGIYAIEVGDDAPRLLGKLLIAKGVKKDILK